MIKPTLDNAIMARVEAGEVVQLPLPEVGVLLVAKIGQSIQLRVLPEDVKLVAPTRAGEGEETL